jgi:Uma2 family endonuclease
MTVTIARWTLADYHSMIDAGLFEGRPIELLNGLVIEMPPEGPEHADASTRLMPQLWAAAKGRYQVRAAKPITIAASHSEPEPDIALVRDKSYRTAHPHPEDIFLVIEFSQTSLAKDTEDKRLVYAQAGIGDYWVVNLRKRYVSVYRELSGGDYRSEQKVASGNLSPLAFPDVVIDIKQFLS